MKHRILPSKLLVVLHMLCAPYITAGVLSNDEEKSPTAKINFYGSLLDHQKESDVDFIEIGGKTKKIPFYNTPEMIEGKYPDMDPTKNIAYVDLDEVKSFGLKNPKKPMENEIKLAGRTYITIEVITQADKVREYLVEATRRVTCKEISLVNNKPLEEERELTFAHIRQMTIQGFTSGNRVESKPLTAHAQEKEAITKDTNTLLDAIESNVKNLPADNPTLLKQMKKSILEMLKSLRSTLQKFLDMVK